jgi:chromosome segregation ATPase
MRLSILFRLTVLATFFGLAAYSLPAQDQSSDDVAAAARKARAQQQNAPKPKKVITNDDIPSKNVEAAAPVSDAGKTDAQKDAGQAARSDGEKDPKNEAYWRKRFKELHDKLAQSEKELDVLQRELDKGQVQFYSDPQKAMTQEYNRSDINEKTTKIDAKKKEIESIKQQISDLEDELRKSGGDSGWAR